MSDYVCSECGKACYHDGRGGDGPILVCGCDKKGPEYYDGRNGDDVINMSPARPVRRRRPRNKLF